MVAIDRLLELAGNASQNVSFLKVRPAAAKEISTLIEGRSKNISASLSAIDAAEKKSEGELVAAANASQKSPQRLQIVKGVASAVMKDLHEVESSKSLSREQRKQKIAHAKQQLMSLENSFAKPEDISARKTKLDNLRKQLEAKKAELEKEKNMLKMAIMQKELLEKKMKLERLIEEKKEKDEKADQQAQMVAIDRL